MSSTQGSVRKRDGWDVASAEVSKPFSARISTIMDPSSGFDTLLTRDITKSSAWQRTGRAGREVHALSKILVIVSLKYAYRQQEVASASIQRRRLIPCPSAQSPKYGDAH